MWMDTRLNTGSQTGRMRQHCYGWFLRTRILQFLVWPCCVWERYEWQCKGQKGIPVPVHQTIRTQTKLLLLVSIDAWRNPLLSHLYVFFKMAALSSDVLVMICYNAPPRAHAGKDCRSAVSLLWWRKVKPMSLLLTWHEDLSLHFVINQKWIRNGVGTLDSLFRVPDCTNYKLVPSYTRTSRNPSLGFLA